MISGIYTDAWKLLRARVEKAPSSDRTMIRVLMAQSLEEAVELASAMEELSKLLEPSTKLA